MRHQIIEITNQYPFLPSYEAGDKKSTSESDGLYWIGIYPPMDTEKRIPVMNTRQLCPWSLAAELNVAAIPFTRRQHVLESLKYGQRAMKQFNVPPNRIMFLEDTLTKKISVWLD